MDTRKIILLGTMQVFNEKGLKFTMDDVSRNLGMSKKTIYKIFANKEEMFLDMVDFLFDTIKESKLQVIADDSLTTLEKIREVLRVIPKPYNSVDFRLLFQLKDKYPLIYSKVEKRLESGWEETLELIEKGMEEGVIRPVSLCLVKLMFEAALEQFFQRDILIENNLSYQEALNQVVDILVDGISVK